MQARCPHCTNVFNTDRAGVQFCPSCGQQINVPDPAAASGPPGAGAGMPPPPPGVPGAGAERGAVPWEERSQRGLFGALFENWKMVIARPEDFWRRMRPDGGLGDALFFGWICYAIPVVLSIPLNFVVQGYNRAQMAQVAEAMKELPPELRQLMEQYMGLLTGGGGVVASLAGLALFPVFFIIGALFTHLFCLIFGAAKNGFNATARVAGYAYAPYVFAWIPGCGGIAALVYFLVLLIWGLARAHETSATRTALAVLLPMVLLCCCCVGGIAVAVASLAQAAGH